MIFLGTSTQCEEESNYDFQVLPPPKHLRRWAEEPAAGSAQWPPEGKVPRAPGAGLARGGGPCSQQVGLPGGALGGWRPVPAQGVPAQPQGQAFYFKVTGESLPEHGGHPSLIL